MTDNEKDKNLPAKIQLDPKGPVTDVRKARALFRFYEGFLGQGLPAQLKPEVLINAVVNSCQKMPALLQCTQESMISALMHCGSVGWVPDTPAQECHLIPFGGKVVVIGGYRGFIKLVRNSGAICNVVSRVVYMGDEFRYELGSTPHIVHIPKLTAKKREDSEITHVYSQIWWKDPTVFPRDDFEVMSKAQVDKIMADVVTKNGGKIPGPWKDHYHEQARKTALKRHMKRLPLTAEMAQASELDNQAVTVEPQPLHQIVQDLVDVTVAEGKKQSLKETVAAKANGETPPAELEEKPEKVDKETGEIKGPESDELDLDQKPPEKPKPEKPKVETEKPASRLFKLANEYSMRDLIEEATRMLIEAADCGVIEDQFGDHTETGGVSPFIASMIKAKVLKDADLAAKSHNKGHLARLCVRLDKLVEDAKPSVDDENEPY